MTNLMRFAKRFKHRAYMALPSLLAVSALFLSLESSESRAQPVDGTQTLVFLRHAEKPDGGLGQLNCQGLNRAIDLSTLLPEKFGKADYVFAANPTRNVEEGELDNSYSYIRPLMTISPAAIKLGLPVNIEFSANDTSDLARELLEDKYHNSTIYTAWSHGYLPELINKVAGQSGRRETEHHRRLGGQRLRLAVCADPDLAQRQGQSAEPQLQAGAGSWQGNLSDLSLADS